MSKEGMPIAAREISAGIGETILPNGRKLRTNIIRYNQGVVTNELDDHETDHGLVAVLRGTKVRIMTVNPGPGSLGRTEFEDGKIDPVSAGAAASQKRRGTGWDEYITIATGHDWEASKSAASSILGTSENQKLHEEVSKELHVYKTLTHYDILRVIDRTRNPKAETVEYDENGREVRSMVQALRKVDGMVPYVIEEDLA